MGGRSDTRTAEPWPKAQSVIRRWCPIEGYVANCFVSQEPTDEDNGFAMSTSVDSVLTAEAGRQFAG